jgi:hypothetical protein
MTSPRRTNPIAAALYVNAALLLAILVALLFRSGNSLPSVLPAAYAQNQPPIAGGAGLFVMPAQLSDRIWGCYVLDSDNQTLTCYQYWPGEKVLRLVAARSIRYDHRLSNFNTDPDPAFVKSLLEKEAQGTRAGTPKQPTSPTEPPKD